MPQRLKAGQHSVELLVLALLVAHFDAVRGSDHFLLNVVDAGQIRAVSLNKRLKRLYVANAALSSLLILREVIGHELLLGRLRHLLHVGVWIPNVAFEHLLIGRL